MAHLFVEIYSVSAEGEVEVPVQSATCLFLFTYLQSPPSLSLSLVLSEATQPSVVMNLQALEFHTITQRSLSSPVSDCFLPVFTTADSTACVAGLCAVLRQVVKHSGEEWHHLLGFREGCLFACAEVSLWTKFCEVDVMQVVEDSISSEVLDSGKVLISEHLARFEEHLNQPVRMHNVDKLRKEINQDCVNHDFAEGYSMSLADLVIVPCVHMFLQALASDSLKHILPSVLRWYWLVIKQEYVSKALDIFGEIPSRVKQFSQVNYMLPEVPKHSLYKSDPKRYKSKLKQFTRQEDVEAALRVVESLDLQVDYDDLPFGYEVPLDWQSVPGGVQPDVPESRLARKREQLENLCKAVIKVARPGDTIVDFCCGSGHLGLALAHWLPQCHIVLLDNKQQSLGRAQARAKQLALPNVTTVQCNLHYFKGHFQVGVSLHACGVASDQVMHSCLQRNAAFVVCPCCYGSLQSNHVVTYPRSSVMSLLSLRHYLVLGHCADQTHKQLYNKSAQGERCMALVDYDRCLLAKEKGYSVSLAKLIPQTCSPKNNLLVGIPQSLTV